VQEKYIILIYFIMELFVRLRESIYHWNIFGFIVKQYYSIMHNICSKTECTCIFQT